MQKNDHWRRRCGRLLRNVEIDDLQRILLRKAAVKWAVSWTLRPQHDRHTEGDARLEAGAVVDVLLFPGRTSGAMA